MTELTQTTDLTADDKIKKLSSLTDSFSKCMAASAKASPTLNKLSLAMDILQIQGKFIQEHFPEHALAFQEILVPFGEEVRKRYAW